MSEDTNVKTQLTQAVKEAMKSGDARRKTTLRMTLAEIKNKEIETGDALDEPTTLGIIQKEVKARRDAIEDARMAGRDDLVEEAEAEIEILEDFLPRQLTQAELEALVDDVIEQTGATSMRDMGKVMGAIMPRVKGRADGSEVSKLVRHRLS